MVRPLLLHPDRDFAAPEPPWNAGALALDLALETLFATMAGDDDTILEVARAVVLSGGTGELALIRHRQSVLGDALERPAVARELYALAGEALEHARKHHLGSLSHYPNWVLMHALDLMGELLGYLRRLRVIADRNAGQFPSPGWSRFFDTLQAELGDDYLATVETHLVQLRLRGGVLLSARLGPGGKGRAYMLHNAPWRPPTWWERFRDWVLGPPTPPFSFAIHPMDQSGLRALDDLKSRGIADVANALARAAEHVREFFRVLRLELAFYVGCLNLRDALVSKGAPICMPEPAPAERARLALRDLRDPTLTLSLPGSVFGNDLAADRRPLVLITGANQGGKTTFLRSLGLAQLMMQAGMFVSAESFAASVCDGLFTHYKRQEDAGMESGKLDEELRRMSEIVDHLAPQSIVLLNESFAATHEREGSEINRQVIEALLDRSVRVACVTHLYELSRTLVDHDAGRAVFLRAERRADGARTFRLAEGAPLPTSFGADLYDEVFGAEAPSVAAAAAG